MTDADFAFFVRAARDHAGIALAPGKRTMLAGRLNKVVRERGCGSFSRYAEQLRAGDADDVREFVDAITTNLTSFFRERHHFDHLRDHALPALLAARQRVGRLRLWSAGCSSGEEAYSMAMVLHEALGPASWDARILATDIDDTVLERAARAVYQAERLADVPERYRQIGFQRGGGASRGLVRIRPAVAARVAVRRLNLMEAWPMRRDYDIIFCRNVAIYFDKPTQRQLIDRFADLLADDGLLFIGHSETLFQVSERFAPLGRTIYRKVA